MFEFIEFWIRKFGGIVSDLYQRSLEINFKAIVVGLLIYAFFPESVQLALIASQKILFSQNEVILSFWHYFTFFLIDIGFAAITGFIVSSIEDSNTIFDVIFLGLIAITVEIFGWVSVHKWQYVITAILILPAFLLGYYQSKKHNKKFQLNLKSFFLGSILYIISSKVITAIIAGLLYGIFNETLDPEFKMNETHNNILNYAILVNYIICAFVTCVVATLILKKDKVINVLLMGSIPLFYSVYFFKNSPEHRILSFLFVYTAVSISAVIFNKNVKKSEMPPPLPDNF
ncbi:MAG: hypothetical protein GY714_16130 [Desulfobacterales bacterium]|nr:hypothetical protein [Desulfobacterales bacterium]